MNPLQRCTTLATAIAALALATGVQAAAPAQPPATTHAAATSTAGARAGTSAKTGKSAKSHKAARPTTRRSTASAEGARSGDNAYRAALRQCITGPAAQRDTCIDDAIARYGHA
ncbi:MAG: hypothetical protein ACM3JC_16350 [Rudaea sp.]